MTELRQYVKPDGSVEIPELKCLDINNKNKKAFTLN
jgi:hypothetical protein